jgi:hypothetical protein
MTERNEIIYEMLPGDWNTILLASIAVIVLSALIAFVSELINRRQV